MRLSHEYCVFQGNETNGLEPGTPRKPRLLNQKGVREKGETGVPGNSFRAG
jgi:hypothetical protein